MQHLIPVDGLFFVGNGRVAMGGKGADICQLFAPCYSLPSILSLRLADAALTAQSHRVRGSAAYVTTLTDVSDGSHVGELTDYTHPTAPVFIRRLRLARPVPFNLETAFSPVNTDALFEGKACARLFEIPEGTPIFSKSKTDKETFAQLLFSPGCEIREGDITFPAGESWVFFVGGEYGVLGYESFPNCMELSRMILSLDHEAVYREFLAHWQRILSGIRVDPSLTEELPEGDELIEAVAVSLVTQTSVQGGVIAGAFYHLASGRDMYGVFRGYMALGLCEYAKKMITYMTDTYRQKGCMPNASGMGMSCSHRHENDSVEQTGYYLLELLEYTEATGDTEFLRERMDYATYLLTVQESQLQNGMLPFNGDETYIAGGIFPRSGIDHGSMEATALYIGSAGRLLSLCEAHGLMSGDEIEAHRRPLWEARARFEENFTEGERVYINNPARVPVGDTPAYRHGVCHQCRHMTWLIRSPEGGYLCPACCGRAEAPVSEERYTTDCALWMTVFAGCSLLRKESIREALARTVAKARATAFGKHDSCNTVGYEYGVLLYTVACTCPPEELAAYRDILDALLDDRVRGSVWTEYYREGKASEASCPYRPWESAINLCGILTYLKASLKTPRTADRRDLFRHSLQKSFA